MASLKKKILAWFPLLSLIVGSITLAEQPLPPVTEWVPDRVTVTIPPDRKNPYAILEWKRQPVFRSTLEHLVLGIEAELIFPELKRRDGERFNATNKLDRADTPQLPKACYYQDNYVLDRCENWTLGISTSKKCLLSALPGELRIDYKAAALPPEATTGRYQIQTVGIDDGRGKGFIPYAGDIMGRTEEAKLVGQLCSALCTVCLGPTDNLLVPAPLRIGLKTACLEAVQQRNPYATWEWFEAFCPSCEAAKNLSVEWRNFLADQAQCVEPLRIPGTTESIGCVRSPYADGCDPIDYFTPHRICAPSEKRCENGQRETCSADGLRWENSFTCGCGCDGNDCGKTGQCSAGSKTCLDSSRLSACRADTCGSTITVCPCGCASNACRSQLCTASYCRDATTLILCAGGGCGTQVVSCGYGCSNNRCNDPPGTMSDMSTGGGPPADMSVPPPPDLAGPPSPEACDGIDNDKNGVIDDPARCWYTVYRFLDPSSSSRCYGTTNVAPPVCSGFMLEGALFSVPSARWIDSSTTERVQCSKANDHVIVAVGSAEQASLVAAGWNCVQPLGHWFDNGRGPNPSSTPFPYRCGVYRMRYATGTGGTAHLFSSQNESFLGTFVCEPPTRGEGLRNAACGKPSGC